MVFLLILLMLLGKEILPLGAAPSVVITGPLPVQRTEM